ncbi:hypothetical protein [Paractinoplanes rishiriensis]|uniref:G domain-containing protein n=1 Tax=Paractinoplanes rishiriensis TaxID=1050105 RepID=A0A919MU90_9ACTN|nr:hypothetical protein [Actinoplanes rishiriensis]GIE95543.1 hypothetical protein Ari01nite_30080 [Actinoplanes rishiriensis]
MSGDELAERVDHLLAQAAQVFRGHERAEMWIAHHRERLTEPLRLAVAGPPRSGKSTLVNALIGEEVAPVRVDGAGESAVWFHDGTQPLARVYSAGAPPYAAALDRTAGGHSVAAPVQWAGAGESAPGMVVEWPCRALRHTRLLDTPGDGDGFTVEHEADAVLYVTRHLGEGDLEALQWVRSGRGAGAYPVQLMVVISRADETDAGRPDALLSARRIARRRRREPRVAALCQDVVAVSGRLAHAGRTLREDEYASIAAIAALPRTDTEPHLLSTDRFTGAGFPAAVPADKRVALLDRLGLGGIRLATTLARTGARSRVALGAQLVRQSGLAELQASISDLFTARRGVLKSRAALIALDQLLRSENRPHLVAELEALVAGAHEFRELRLLAGLRTGRVSLPDDLAAEARRLAGGQGTAHAERLGVAAHASAEELWPAAEDAAVRWREQTTAATTAGGRRAADVVLRSCTAILNDLG